MGPSLIDTVGTAAQLHGRELPDPLVETIWRQRVTAPAIVLGSNQSDSIVDVQRCRTRGVEVVRRRSGGGAVLLTPGDVIWLDVIVPSTSDSWLADIHAQMVWLGDRLAAAIGVTVAPDRLAVHRGASVRTRWSDTICFDGLGAGEVLLDGVKLVGISQRRTREAARLQACWYSSYSPEALGELLAIEVRPLVDDLRPIATLDAEISVAVPSLLQEMWSGGGDMGHKG